MSLRRTPAEAGKVDHAAEIRKTIQHAKLAHDSFMRSNPDISAIMTPQEKQEEMDTPFVLSIQQEYKDQGQERIVEISVTLSNGVYARLYEMSDALTNKLKGSFERNTYSIDDRGTVNKVCSNPSASYTTWTFAKTLQADDIARTQTPGYWMLPEAGDRGNVTQFLASAFQTPNYNPDTGELTATVGDNSYKFMPVTSKIIPGVTVEYTLIPQ